MQSDGGNGNADGSGALFASPVGLAHNRAMAESALDKHHRLLAGVPVIDSPFFEAICAEGAFDETEEPVARSLHQDGFALIDFPDPQIAERAERITQHLDPLFSAASEGGEDFDGRLMPPRFQDAQVLAPDVREIAGNASVMALLAKLYGRDPFPFQTLIFRKGSQQHLHSDAVHFNSWPKGFMCGVWLALEDITAHNGPLLYHPGSHRWAIYDNDQTVATAAQAGRPASQAAFHDLWNALGEQQGTTVQRFMPRKGQALIWAANLLHGGAEILDPSATRWSQVTHYFFDNCAFYRPMASHLLPGSIAFIDATNALDGQAVPARYGETPVPQAYLDTCRERQPPGAEALPLPDDFDGDRYLELNPDVAAAGADPHGHYQVHGRLEGRRYR